MRPDLALKWPCYLEFHLAVMGSKGRLTEAGVMGIARSIGLDADRLRTDMEDPAIHKYLDETARLARALGIGGTLAFVIGDTRLNRSSTPPVALGIPVVADRCHRARSARGAADSDFLSAP